MKTPTKPTVMEIRQAHQLTSQQVADEAGVPLRVAYLLEIGGLVHKREAGKVIAALATLTGEPYTVESFDLTDVQAYWRSMPAYTPVGDQRVRH
jgi:hypothetical protein